MKTLYLLICFRDILTASKNVQNPLVARLVFGFSFSGPDAPDQSATSVFSADFGPAKISPKTPWEDRYHAAYKSLDSVAFLFSFFFSTSLLNGDSLLE